MNKIFNETIMEKKNLYSLRYNYDKYSITNRKINDLCCKKTTVNTFEWLMGNNISFSLTHIRSLIMKDRIDVLKSGTKYQDFLDVLFNRFYHNDFNDLFTYSDSTSPLIIAGTYNKVEVVDLLLNCRTRVNPYLKGFGSLFELSLRHIHKNLLSYLISNHYDKIKDKLNIKINTIIQRFDNIDDILFHLVLSNKVEISHKFLSGLITKVKNNDLFFYCFLNRETKDIKLSNLFGQSILYSNYEIFNFLLSENRYEINNNILSNLLIENLDEKMIKKEFIYNLINNHINRLNLDIPLIKISIDNNIDEQTIEQLVIFGFNYSYEEMEIVLNNRKLNLLKVLVNYYKE